MSTLAYANNSSFMGMAVETTRGTAAAAPTIFIPVSAPKITPNITQEEVKDFVGSMVETIDVVNTVRHDEYTFTCRAYVDTLPALLKGVLGVLTSTGTAAPYTHTATLLNNAPATGNQPPSYTFFDWDGGTLRTMAGGQISQVDIKFTATALVELTVTVLTMPYTTSAVMPTATFSTVAAAPAWSATAQLNSVASVIVDGALSIKRNVKASHALGQQGPYVLWAGPLGVTGSLTVINTNDAEQNLYLNGTAVPLSLVFTPPSPAGSSFAFTMSKTKLRASHQERGSDGMVVTMLDLEPVGNATDAGAGGGLADIKAVVTNSTVPSTY